MSDVIDLMASAYMRYAYKYAPETTGVTPHQMVVAGLHAAIRALADNVTDEMVEAADKAYDQVSKDVDVDASEWMRHVIRSALGETK